MIRIHLTTLNYIKIHVVGDQEEMGHELNLDGLITTVMKVTQLIIEETGDLEMKIEPHPLEKLL